MASAKHSERVGFAMGGERKPPVMSPPAPAPSFRFPIPALNVHRNVVVATGRYDFGNKTTTAVCLMVSGGHCVSPFGSDYSNCTVRCWGYGFSGDQARRARSSRGQHYIDQFDNTDSYRRADLDSSLATDVWEYPKGPVQLQL